MGISWSKRHHRLDHQEEQHQHHHYQHPPFPPSNPAPLITHPQTAPTPPQPPSNPPPHGSNPPAHGPTYAFAANAPYSTAPPPPQHPYPAPPPAPPPHLPPYNYGYNFSGYYSRPVNITGQQYSNYRPYYAPQIGGWGPSVPPPPLPPPLPAVPYVDHLSAKKIKNDVNIHKDTIRLQLDEQHPDCHLVSFTFDALLDGSITIFYFAKEGDNCRFTPVYPEIVPVRIPFQKGIGQKFSQPSGTGVDLGFFDINDLSKPVPGDNVYPLVISAESVDEQSDDRLLNASPRAQITQAVLEKNDGGDFKVKVMKQILWIDGARYELREIFGISDSGETAINDVDSGKECIICLTEVKNTAVLPCRHMCMCSDCAKELRLQSNKCPVCRQPIEELLEIKVEEETGAKE